jgi:S1-C subfamily serine protease
MTLVVVLSVLAAMTQPTRLHDARGQRSFAWPLMAQKGGRDCGWIGVQVSPMTRPFADSLGMTELYGAIFDRPEAGSPAAHEHIQAGDVLTEINGEPLRRASDFQAKISATAPGTIIYLTTYRDGQLIERKVTLRSGICPRHS